MNKALTLITAATAFSLSAITAHGQLAHARTHHTPDAVSKARQRVGTILSNQRAQQHKVAAKTTVDFERLIASSVYNFEPATGMPLGKTDSASYKYSGSNRSTFNRDFMNYLAPSGSFFSTDFPMGYINYGAVHTSTNMVDQNTINADTSVIFNSFVFDGTDYVYGLANVVTATRDVNGHATYCSDQYYPVDSSGQWNHFINTYDAANNISSSINIEWQNPGWDTMSRISYVYDAAHRLIQDSADYWAGPGMWSRDTKDIFTYDASGNLLTSLTMQDSSGYWVDRIRVQVAYNTDNTLHTDSVSYFDGTNGWVPDVTDSFGYTAGANYWTYLRARYYDGPTVDENISAKHVNAAGLPDTLTSMEYNAAYGVAPSYLIYGSKSSFVYDSYSNPTIYTAAFYNITDSATGAGSFSTTPSGLGRFYYETITSTGVKDVAAAQEAISIYPNPATNELRISRPSATQGAYTVIKFTDAVGHIVRTDAMPWMSETQTFSLAGFAPGMYIITLQNKNGEVLTTQKIIKQ